MSLWSLLLLAGVLAAVGKPPSEDGESIEVRVRGKVTGGMMAIGGETTGTTIQARGVTWELDFGGDDALRAKAEALDGKMAFVTGSLEARPGVEIKTRWILRVDSIAAAGAAAPKTPPTKAK